MFYCISYQFSLISLCFYLSPCSWLFMVLLAGIPYLRRRGENAGSCWLSPLYRIQAPHYLHVMHCIQPPYSQLHRIQALSQVTPCYVSPRSIYVILKALLPGPALSNALCSGSTVPDALHPVSTLCNALHPSPTPRNALHPSPTPVMHCIKVLRPVMHCIQILHPVMHCIQILHPVMHASKSYTP